jgi:hypothetical protein
MKAEGGKYLKNLISDFMGEVRHKADSTIILRYMVGTPI